MSMNNRQGSAQSSLGIDVLAVSLRDLRRLPFFDMFHSAFLDCVALCGRPPSTSYAIWGGAAANILLMLVRRTRTHFCFHDIEVFATASSNILLDDDLLNAIESRLLHEYKAPLVLGGRSIVEDKCGMPVSTFQDQRISMADGDLFLNNVLLSVNARSTSASLYVPVEVFGPLSRGESSLLMKDASSLQDLHRITRRICRTIGKAIRFDRVAGLFPTNNGLSFISSLIDTYEVLLLAALQKDHKDPRAKLSGTEDWLNEAANLETGRILLCKRVLSESAKRLAGLYGIACNDLTRFERIFVGGITGCDSLLKHPLITLLIDRIVDRASLAALVGPQAMERYYSDFSAYQALGSEELCRRYSLAADLDPPVSLHR